MDSLKLQCVIDPGTAPWSQAGTKVIKLIRQGKEVSNSQSATAVLDNLYAEQASMLELRFGSGLSDFKRWVDDAVGVMRRSRKEAVKLAQESMLKRGLPDEFVVWAQPTQVNAKAYGNVLLSPSGDFIGEGFEPYLVKRDDILADLNTLVKTTDAENPLYVETARLTPTDASAKQFIQEFMGAGGRNIDEAAAGKAPTAIKKLTKADIKKVSTDYPVYAPNANYAVGFQKVTKYVTPDGKSFKLQRDAIKHIEELNAKVLKEVAEELKPGITMSTKPVTKTVSDDAFRVSFNRKDSFAEWLNRGLGGSHPKEVKINLNEELTEAVLDNELVDPIAQSLDNWNAYVRASKAKGVVGGREISNIEQYVEVRVRNTIDGWARSSMDRSDWAVAVQRKAAEMYGDDSGLAILRKLVDAQDKAVWEASQKVLDREGDMIESILRQMYEHTQSEFRAAGIKTVRLYRGYATDTLPAGVKQSQVLDVGTNLENYAKGVGKSVDEVVEDIMDGMVDFEKVTGISRGAPVGQTSVDNSLNPLSSFSSDLETATQFSTGAETGGGGRYSIIIAADVPVDYIVGTARTGFGCLEEMEAVISGRVHGKVSYQIIDYSNLDEDIRFDLYG